MFIPKPSIYDRKRLYCIGFLPIVKVGNLLGFVGVNKCYVLFKAINSKRKCQRNEGGHYKKLK